MYIVSIYGVNTKMRLSDVLYKAYAVSWEGVLDDSVVEIILKDEGMSFGKTNEHGFRPTHYKCEKAPGHFYHPAI